MKIGHLIDRVMGNVFFLNFAQFGGLHPKPMSKHGRLVNKSR